MVCASELGYCVVAVVVVVVMWTWALIFCQCVASLFLCVDDEVYSEQLSIKDFYHDEVPAAISSPILLAFFTPQFQI